MVDYGDCDSIKLSYDVFLTCDLTSSCRILMLIMIDFTLFLFISRIVGVRPAILDVIIINGGLVAFHLLDI